MNVVPMPLSWAGRLIEKAGGSFPTYGSQEWLQLADDDRRKVAACVAAAEAWRTRNYRGEILEIGSSSRRAREIAEARRHRPGDHPGGSVPWERDEVASDG